MPKATQPVCGPIFFLGDPKYLLIRRSQYIFMGAGNGTGLCAALRPYADRTRVRSPAREMDSHKITS